MSKLPVISGKELIKALMKIGYCSRDQDSARHLKDHYPGRGIVFERV